jgi:hypothetical protein
MSIDRTAAARARRYRARKRDGERHGGHAENASCAGNTAPMLVTPPGELVTVRDVLAELAVLYRGARAGQIKTADASRLGNLLGLMIRGHDAAVFDDRLAALEDRMLTEVHARPLLRVVR